jgi:hypothetical protein
VTIFNTKNLSHFEHCAIAVKKARSSVADNFYEQTLNEIRICSKIGYHRNVCAMLGYVSTNQLTCLLLELADTSLYDALIRMKQGITMKTNKEIVDIVRYLKSTTIQIVDGMVQYFKLNSFTQI